MTHIRETASRMPSYEELLDAIYVEDCHARERGHDRLHMPRILGLFGIDSGAQEYEDLNRVPRRLNRGESGFSAYEWYKRHEHQHAAFGRDVAELERWEREGLVARVPLTGLLGPSRLRIKGVSDRPYRTGP